MSENEANQNNEEEKKPESPWMNIVYGLIAFAAAYYLYSTFTSMETEGGSVRINRIAAILYQIGGKWTPTVLVGLIGVFYTYLGIKNLTKNK